MMSEREKLKFEATWFVAGAETADAMGTLIPPKNSISGCVSTRFSSAPLSCFSWYAAAWTEITKYMDTKSLAALAVTSKWFNKASKEERARKRNSWSEPGFQGCDLATFASLQIGDRVEKEALYGVRRILVVAFPVVSDLDIFEQLWAFEEVGDDDGLEVEEPVGLEEEVQEAGTYSEEELVRLDLGDLFDSLWEKFRVYDTNSWEEILRGRSKMVLRIGFDGWILFVDEIDGIYVYYNFFSRTRTELPEVPLRFGDVYGIWSGTPGNADCVTYVFECDVGNDFWVDIHNVQGWKSMLVVLNPIQNQQFEVVDEEEKKSEHQHSRDEEEDDSSDEEESSDDEFLAESEESDIEDDMEFVRVMAFFLHHGRFHLLMDGFVYACVNGEDGSLEMSHNLSEFVGDVEERDTYRHISFIEDGEDLYLMLMKGNGDYMMFWVDYDAASIIHVPDHRFPASKVAYSSNIYGGKVVLALSHDERNSIIAAGGGLGDEHIDECIQKRQGEPGIRILKMCHRAGIGGAICTCFTGFMGSYLI